MLNNASPSADADDIRLQSEVKSEMSVIGTLEQIPPEMYQQLQQYKYSEGYEAILELYDLAKETSNPEEQEIDLQEDNCTDKHVKVLKSLDFDAISMINSVQRLLNSSQMSEMDLGRRWDDMLLFLIGEISPDEVLFILNDKTFDNVSIHLVNALVQGGENN